MQVCIRTPQKKQIKIECWKENHRSKTNYFIKSMQLLGQDSVLHS